MLTCAISNSVLAGEIAITFDDAPTVDSAVMSGAERTAKLIAALQKSGVEEALFFVLTKNITEQSAERLTRYQNAGFKLGNHSASHESANTLSAQDFLADSRKAHQKLKTFSSDLRYFRFPYLHYGDSKEKRTAILTGLKKLGYQMGYVTVDNFDWYINSLYVKAVEEGKSVNLKNLEKLYVDTLWESILFYDKLALKYMGHSPKHVLLLHENDLAAQFLPSLINKIKNSGWTIISPEQAYKDVSLTASGDNYNFSKQGRVAAIAESKGAEQSELRSKYENTETLDKLFLQYQVIP